MSDFTQTFYKSSKTGNVERLSPLPVRRRNGEGPVVHITASDDPYEDTKEDTVSTKHLQPEANTGSAVKKRLSFNFKNISVADLSSSLRAQTKPVKSETSETKENESEEKSRKNKPVPFADLSSSLILNDKINSTLYSKEKSFHKKITDLNVTEKTFLKKDVSAIWNTRENVNFSKSTIMKTLSVANLSMTVKDLSSSLIRQVISRDNSRSSEDFHEHCHDCHDMHCKKINDCPIIRCKNGCGDVFFHQCKQEEHDELCRCTTIPCINSQYGCHMEMPRHRLAYHLKECGIMAERRKTVQPKPDHMPLKEKVSDPTNDKDYSTPKKAQHNHCTKCISMSCEKMENCPVIKCRNRDCQMKLHKCKMADHQNVCLYSEIYCINQQYGCTYYMTKILLNEHLQRCTAMSFDFLNSPQFNYANNSTRNHHCDTCYATECTTDVREECRFVKCNLCFRNLHYCKFNDHMTICSVGLTECINAQHGCQMVLTRCLMTTHLLHCPLMNWSLRLRKPEKKPESEDEGDYQTIDIVPNEEKSKENKSKDEHIYEKLPKHAKKKGKKKTNCRVS